MTNQKIYKKLRKKSIVGPLFSVLLFTLITVSVALVVLAETAMYVVDTKLAGEYEIIRHMASIYDEFHQSGGSEIFDILDLNEREYVVLDKAGKVIHVTGKDTRESTGSKVRFNFSSGSVDTYADKEIGLMYPDGSGRIGVDAHGFWIWFKEDILEKQGVLNDGDVDFSHLPTVTGEEGSFRVYKFGDVTYFVTPETGQMVGGAMPLWMSADIGQTGLKIVGKALFAVKLRDMDLLVAMSATVGILLTILILYAIIHIIVGALRQKKISGYFLTDVVTKGNNWMYFVVKGEEIVKSFFNRNNNYAVVSIVFVNYTNYVVSHSREEGEALIARVYGLLSSFVAKRKEICAHTAPSSFAMLLRYDDAKALQRRIKKLLIDLDEIDDNHKFSFQAGIKLIDRSASAGSENYTERKNIDIENEYNKASTAREVLSETDESGLSVFDEQIVKDQQWLDTVQERQFKAIKNEEFKIYYQPKYNPRTNELSGAEALVRWDSSDLGFVTPSKFIPIFERNGFITHIDHYMLEHVAADQKKWHDEGFKCVPVSVNVSRAHFVENDLAEQIRDIVDRAGCPHELIEIELTESAFFDDKKAMIETINKLKGYGFSVSMDDFGAGYSSLNSLKDMPLDVLKLDAEFFRGTADDGRGEIVVSEAIKLAKNLNMRIVAEGVELREQVDFLAAEGCDMIQGYYYAKPMPQDEYEKRMTSGRNEEGPGSNEDGNGE